MQRIKNLLMIVLLGSITVAAPAMAAPATDASVKQLLDVMHTKSLLDSITAKMNVVLEQEIQQSLQGKTPTPAQRQAITNYKNRMQAIYRKAIAWQSMEPKYIQIYRESLSEEDVTAMLAFYKTPAGQEIVRKMPTIMNNTMLAVRETLQTMIPEIQQATNEFKAQIKSAGN
jgi:hypothetical protein